MLSVRLSKDEENLIKKFAKFNNMSLSEFVRSTLLDSIENQYDLEIFEKAWNEMECTYTLEETKKELGL